MPILLETDRLLVRPWTTDDVEAAFAILGDPEVTRYLGDTGDAFADRDRIHGWLERIVARTAEWNPYGSWAVVENATGDIIGGGGLFQLEGGPDVEVFYHFRQISWGYGYATELARALIAYAFASTDLPRVIGVAFPANTASHRVLTKAGMTHLGQRHAYGADLEYFTIDRPTFPARKQPDLNLED
ncbi:MAG TPA: GNAT family N-acetyltransferase [Thermomicrobiales bacterium]|nr:GNAT family N-acetyltransferase [Thermomicrobiales bacterium]